MPRFITYFTYTAGAAKAMIAQPSDRTAAAKALVESLGGTLEGFYWMQGAHDGFLITNLPDGDVGAALSLAASATGDIANLESHQIYDQDDQAAILKKAAVARGAYRPPTA